VILPIFLTVSDVRSRRKAGPHNDNTIGTMNHTDKEHPLIPQRYQHAATLAVILLSLFVFFREIVFETEPNHISNVKVTALSPTEMEISWETNHLSTSQVNYGSAVGTYEFTAFSGEQTREHTTVLTGLNSGATYYYELISKNRDYAVDAFRSFTTPAK